MVIHSMKESSEKAVEINIEHRLNVAEQQDDKTFKVKSDMKFKKSQLPEPPWKNRSVCVTCNQTLALKIGCKQLTEEEHTELWWNFCDKMFSSRKEVDNCIYESCAHISRECT